MGNVIISHNEFLFMLISLRAYISVINHIHLFHPSLYIVALILLLLEAFCIN